MANKNRNLIIAYFLSKEKAEKAARLLKKWDIEPSLVGL